MPAFSPGWTARFRVLRNVPFALLCTAGVISLAGDWALTIGLAYFVFVLTGSTLATGTLLLTSILPQALVGPLAGVFVDRWSRKRTMIGANLALAAGLLPLLLVHAVGQLWIIYAVAIFESVVSPFFSPAEGALIPMIVGEEELLSANSIYGAGRQLSRLAGAGAGGLLVGLFGLMGVTLVDAASFVVAAALLVPIVEARRPLRGAISRAGSRLRSVLSKFRREWLEGLAAAARSRQGIVVLIFGVITGLGEGVFGTLAAPFVVSVLHGSGPDYGWFNSFQAVGGVVGGVYVAMKARTWDPIKVLPVTSVAFGALDLALFNYPLVIPGIGLAFVLMGIVGVPGAAVGASFTSLQQSAVGDSHRGRYISLSQSTTIIAMVAGLTLAGFLGGPIGIIPMLEIQGAAYITAGLLVPLARVPHPVSNGSSSTEPKPTAPPISDP
jgi:Na+/melibiose symporter-like transporter